MSSQASSAGGGEAKLRQKLVESGDVDIMIAIRSNFFYTRTVPCELWFFDRDKPLIPSPPPGETANPPIPPPPPDERANPPVPSPPPGERANPPVPSPPPGERARVRGKDTVLMLDARNVYRKVTRKIYDFSPEQQQNLLAIVWLYRGETERFLELVSEYLGRVTGEGRACFEWENEDANTSRPLPEYVDALTALRGQLAPFLKTQPKTGPHAETLAEFEKEQALFAEDVERFHADVSEAATRREKTPATNAGLNKLVDRFSPLAETSRGLVKQTDLLYKLATRLIETCEKECHAKASKAWAGRDITRARKAADEARHSAVKQLKQVRYFWRQAHWLTERFPQARLCNVEGLVKLVDRAEIEANDWSLTPGRYVGVAPEEEDEDFDFEETLREIHVELEDLNAEAATLAATIKKNFEELGV